MKRILALLGVCALLGAAQQAKGTAYSLQATGNWNNSATWATSEGGTYPSSGSDTATFSTTTGRTVTVNGSFSYGATTATYPATVTFDTTPDYTLTTTSLTVNAAARAVTLTQTGDAGDVFQINGNVAIWADQDAANNAMLDLQSGAFQLQDGATTNVYGGGSADAIGTLKLNGATLDPEAIILWGGPSSARKSLFDFETGTLSNPDSVTMYEYASIDAEDSMTIDGAVTVSADGAATVATIDMLTGETFTSSSMVIGHTGYSCTLTLQDAGTFDVNGTVSMVASTTDNAHSKLAVDVAIASPFTPNAFDIEGGSSSVRSTQFDIDENVTVQGITGTDTYMIGYVDWDVAVNKTVALKDTLFDADCFLDRTGSGTFQTDEFKVQDAGADLAITLTKTGSSSVSASSLVIVGGNSVGETATCTVSAGSIVTRN